MTLARLRWCVAIMACGLTPGEAGGSSIPLARRAHHLAVIPITGPIDNMTVSSLRSRMDEAKKIGADAVVLELATPGGELMATLEITHLIRTQAPSNTVAWVNPHAFSAGTIIALSTREIITSPEATFGDAAPVTPFGPLPAAERAKIESPLLAELTDEARRHHYDERLVQAFVSVGIELWMLRDPATGEVVFVDRAEYQRVYGDDPPDTLTPITPPQGDEPFEVHPLLTMFQSLEPASEEGIQDIDSVAHLPPIRSLLTPQDASRLELVGQVVSNDRLLTLKPWQAEVYGLSAGSVGDDTELLAFFGAERLTRLEPSWSEGLARALVAWPVRVAFIALFVVCVLIEMALPGTGWFGLGALASLGVLLGAPMLVGLADWWDLLAVGIGVLLIATEILIIPGTVIAGLCGALLLLLGLVGSVVSGDLTSTTGQDQLVRGGLVVIVGAAIGWMLAWQALKRIERSGRSLAFVLDDAPNAPSPTATSRIGMTGRTLTPLRPSGRIEVEGEAVDAVCSGRWIEADIAVRITRDGLVVEVEPLS